MMLTDPDARRRNRRRSFASRRFAAEYAVSRVMRRYAKALESINGGHLATRVADIFDLEKRILSRLLGQRREQLTQLTRIGRRAGPRPDAERDRLARPASASTPSPPKRAAAPATPPSWPASWKSRRWSASARSPPTFPAATSSSWTATRVCLSSTRTRRRWRSTSARAATSTATRPGSTNCATCRPSRATACASSCSATSNSRRECTHCLDRGGEGVGLYRTEFLYLGKKADPTEEEHLEAYLSVLKALGPKRPLVIRTLDLGADKFQAYSGSAHHERNPFLGLRSVRLCLQNLPLFKTQMRAILRASAFGDVRVMFPMISTVLELRQCKMILAEVKEDLEEEGVAFNAGLPIGTMIEVPSAAIMAEQLAREVDFFSIGTNDLIQYTLAADRNNEAVAGLYNAGDPAVLRLIETVVKAAKKNGTTVTVCGEMSGEPLYILLLLGLGLRQLSVTPHNIPEIKKFIRLRRLDAAVETAREALRLETARDVNNYLREQTRRICPEVVN